MKDNFKSIPFIIYKVYDSFKEEKIPNRKLELLNATYANIFRYIGSILLSEYILEDKADIKVNNAINALIRPSLGSWVNFIRVYLKFKEGKEIFIKEMPSLFKELQKSKFHVIEDSIRSNKRHSKDAANAILELRNMLAHGSTPPTSEEAKEILDLYTPCLEHIIEVFLSVFNDYIIGKFISVENEFFENKAHFTVVSNFELQDTISISVEEECSSYRKGELCLIHKENGVLPLSCFFNDMFEADFTNRERYVVYDGMLNKSVIYVGVETRLHLDQYIDIIRNKFSSKEIDMKWKKEGFKFKEFKEYINELSAISVLLHINSEKYKTEMYLERKYDDYIQDFLKSDKTAIIITAEAGVGKTSLLCRTVERIINKNGAVYFINGSSLINTEDSCTIFNRLKKEGLDNNEFRSFYDFLEFINGYISGDESFVIVIDALNEAYNTLEILSEIDDIVSQAKRYPWIKIIASIRTSSYEILRDRIEDRLGKPFPLFSDIVRYYTFTEGGRVSKELNIKEWTLSETLKAFNLYRDKYKVAAAYSFHKLSREIKDILKNPLNMSIFFQVNSISHKTEIVSEKHLFNAYYNCLSQRGLSKTTEKLLEQIIAYMFENHTNSIELDEVVSLDDKLMRNARISNDLSVLTPFERLKDLGILQEKKTLKGYMISFVYQKQLEYLLYRYIKEAQLEPEEIVKEFVEAYSWNKLKEGQMALTSLMEEWQEDVGYLKEISLLCKNKLIPIESFRFNIIQLLFKNLAELKENRDKVLLDFVKFLKENNILNWAVELLSNLFQSGYAPIGEKLFDIFQQYVHELELGNELDFYYTGGLTYQHQCKMDKANECFNQCLSVCTSLERGKYIVQISKTYRQDGDVQKAEKIVDKFITDSSEDEKRIIYYAEALAQKGLCLYANGKHQEAYKYYEAADELAVELNEENFRLYNLLGITTALEKMNEVEKAKEMLLKIYDDSNRFGFQNLMIDAMNGLASKSNILGQYDDSIYWASEGLALWEYSNFYRGQMVMCIHIINAMARKKAKLEEIQPIIDKANALKSFVSEKLILNELEGVMKLIKV